MPVIVTVSCSAPEPRHRELQLQTEELEKEFVELKKRYRLLKKKNLTITRELEEIEEERPKTPEYYYQKGLEYEGTDTFTAYDFFRILHDRYPGHDLTDSAIRKMQEIGKLNYDRIMRDLNSKPTRVEKIESLEQNLLIYHEYLGRPDLELLVKTLKTLKQSEDQ
ncbi:MAG: hypothetical protein JXO48_01925 [Deltaproteobacteria bacterium]|nr:hypothetical protein [Deltaproteobacteria bacterium]